jgi:hypothetical protein
VLIRLAAVLAAVAAPAVVVACSPTPPPSAVLPAADYTVTARWSADDGSIVVLNVVAADGVDRRNLPATARRYREEHPGSRVIITFFADSAGEERYVVGHVPAGGGPLPVASRGTSWLATFDYPAPVATPS